jgi:hypothetical protein
MPEATVDDFADLVGMKVQDAVHALIPRGYVLWQATIDGKPGPALKRPRADRVQVAAEGGKVTAILAIG